jgi:N utilization substance protein B
MTKPTSRHRARELVVQALYQWHMTQHSALEIELQFREEGLANADQNYFSTLLQGVITKYPELDEKLLESIDREINELNPVELAILRLATYELLFQPDVPYKVVINEACELAKKFGSVDGYKYVNGVLDHLANKMLKGQ